MNKLREVAQINHIDYMELIAHPKYISNQNLSNLYANSK